MLYIKCKRSARSKEIVRKHFALSGIKGYGVYPYS